jgi:SAM-dependent methyltransferase
MRCCGTLLRAASVAALVCSYIMRPCIAVDVASVDVAGTASDVVRERYEELSYPTQDDVKAMWAYIKDGPGWLSAFARAAWGSPEQFDFCALDAPLRVLLPGCGTGNALVQTIAGVLVATADCPEEPRWEAVCMDLSSASLSVARQKAAMLGLDPDESPHVSFVRKDLLLLDPAVDGVYDLISSTGVLHHLEDPAAGFRALQGVLRRGGAMEIM